MLRHSHKKKNNNIILIVVLAALFIGALIWIVKANSKEAAPAVSPAQVDALAQCLTDKGVKMYGASRCPHCKAQKEMFGTSFSKIDYIECTTDAVKCNIAGVKGYPTWIYQGQKYEGEQTFDALAQIAGCSYAGSSTDVSGGISTQ